MITLHRAVELLSIGPDQRESLRRVAWWTPTLMGTGRAAERLERWVERGGLREESLTRDQLERGLYVVTGRPEDRRSIARALAALVEQLPPPVRTFTRDTCWFLSTGDERVGGFAYPLHAAARATETIVAELLAEESRGVHWPTAQPLPQAWADERWMILFRSGLDVDSDMFRYVAAHEIAHGWLGHDGGTHNFEEPEAKWLAVEWMSVVRGGVA